MANPFSFGAGVSQRSTVLEALDEALASARSCLLGPPHLAFLFFTPDFIPELSLMGPAVARKIGADHLVASSAEAIVSGAKEYEVRPALSVWLAHLPNVAIEPRRLSFESNPDGGTLSAWSTSPDSPFPSDAFVLLLGDPFSFPTDLFLDQLNSAPIAMRAAGGMASGGTGPRTNRLMLGENVYEDGAVGVVMSGPIRLKGVTSQGCRPVGKTYIATRTDRNVLEMLGGRPALEVLQEIYSSLPVSDQQLFQSGLHVGRVIEERQEVFTSQDFLIRNVLGVEPQSGGVMVGDFIRPGQTIQFHVRDSASASAELKRLIHLDGPPPAGALLFTCNGRGSRMFAAPHHDAEQLSEAWNQPAIAGMFCAGEIGNVGGKNFIHGFTASIAALEPLE